MKKIINHQALMSFVYLLFVTFVSVYAFGQDSTSVSSSTTTTTTEQTTTIQPWVWVVGGAVLLLIIIALVRGNSGGSGSRTDKVTYTKTTSSEQNP